MREVPLYQCTAQGYSVTVPQCRIAAFWFATCTSWKPVRGHRGGRVGQGSAEHPLALQDKNRARLRAELHVPTGNFKYKRAAS